MTLEQKVGQLLMVNLPLFETSLAEFNCGSLLLWGETPGIGGPRDLCAMANRAQELSMKHRGVPVWLHGWVDGLGWSPDWLARASLRISLAETERIAALFGRRWRAVGLCNLPEPCLNVPLFKTCIMRQWLIAEDPDAVTRLGVALTRGVTASRCGTMAQHFPAHGATPIDSHTDFPVVALPREELLRDHIRPYQECFKAGCKTLCTAHLACPALDPDPSHVATTSRAILGDFLRGELGFQGLIIADAIGMRGFQKNGPPETVCVDAVNAGCDCICITQEDLSFVEKVFNTLLAAAKAGTIPAERLDDAALRHLQFMRWLGLFDKTHVSPEEAEALLRDDKDLRLLKEIG